MFRFESRHEKAPGTVARGRLRSRRCLVVYRLPVFSFRLLLLISAHAAPTATMNEIATAAPMMDAIIFPPPGIWTELE
jgi:hypothetical protein